MLTNILEDTVEEVSEREVEKRLQHLKYSIDSVLNGSEDLWKFREIHDPKEISRQIEERKRQYGLKGIAFPIEDPFDAHSRFWTLTGPGVYKGVAAVRINNPIGVSPSGLNLLSKKELVEFSERYPDYHNGEALTESTLDEKEREKFRTVLEKYGKEENAYEVRALFTADSHPNSSPILILGLIKSIYEEGWKFGSQTHHPDHSLFYKRVLPYTTIAGETQKYVNPNDITKTPRNGFLDIFGRPAQTLGIAHGKFAERYKQLIENYMNRL